MKITSFYYLAYPDCLPEDPLCARSEVYVEVAERDGDIHHFDYLYSVTVCTTEYIRKEIATHGLYAESSVVVVDRFDNSIIEKALEAILPDIDSIGFRKE